MRDQLFSFAAFGLLERLSKPDVAKRSVNRICNLCRDDLQQQTTSGQLQFQREGAEHFLCNIELQLINYNQAASLKLVGSKSEMQVSAKEPQTIEILN